MIPLTVSFVDLRDSGSVVCAVATLAAIKEGHLIRIVLQVFRGCRGKADGGIWKSCSGICFISIIMERQSECEYMKKFLIVKDDECCRCSDS